MDPKEQIQLPVLSPGREMGGGPPFRAPLCTPLHPYASLDLHPAGLLQLREHKLIPHLLSTVSLAWMTLQRLSLEELFRFVAEPSRAKKKGKEGWLQPKISISATRRETQVSRTKWRICKLSAT